jgi:phosphoribosylformylglycinamidine synthase
MVHRIEVCAKDDILGADFASGGAFQSLDTGGVRSVKIFLLEGELSPAQLERIARELLSDVVTDDVAINPKAPAEGTRVEVHFKPGVMDPEAQSTLEAIRMLGLDVSEVRTARGYQLAKPCDPESLRDAAARFLANSVVENVEIGSPTPLEFPRAPVASVARREVALCALSDDELVRLSREGHLFLSLPEMQAVQEHFRQVGREPTDIELETIAQTWSEHCVHKTLKSRVEVVDEAGKRLREYGNLIRDTIFRSTQQLVDTWAGEPFCLSVFKDNAGVVAFDDESAVCFKVETHNHPSAIEPYGGAATGIGGCIRDILGTGLGARPIANTDVFCVAYPDSWQGGGSDLSQAADAKPLPPGVIHPQRVLRQVVAGVRDYGNRMGIPTVNGAVYFDDRYIGNPLVYCGCVGWIPRDAIQKAAREGDHVVVMGGRTGRDGIHGATFSSAELTSGHADEFSHAVQIGNAITQKKMADVVLRARDLRLFSAITDCGAGGLSSAVGEIGEKLGAEVWLERVPLKYAGLRYDEIWISEAQERMVLSVPTEKLEEFIQLAASEGVEATAIGRFGTPGRELVLSYQGTEVGRLSMEFLHNGIPMPTRRAVVVETATKPSLSAAARVGGAGLAERLLNVLAHPNVASKQWIIRQYDHEVQGGSVVKPLTGPRQAGPSDASVTRPLLRSWRGVAVGCGLAPHIEDPYEMTVAAIDEAVRNVICVGAEPGRIAMLDNFCWPSADDPATMGTLVRSCEACRDVALAYRIPFISGKDSLHNQFTDQLSGEVIRVPRTLLISTLAVLTDVRRCITMDLKAPGANLLRVGPTDRGNSSPADCWRVHEAVARAMAEGLVASAHDVSDGGTLACVAEMCIGGERGAAIYLPHDAAIEAAFDEPIATYVLEVSKSAYSRFMELMQTAGVRVDPLGHVSDVPMLVISSAKGMMAELPVEQLLRAWTSTLDWSAVTA